MSKVARATIGLMIVTMLSKILGFGRELVLTYAYGASYISDVYITTLSIPTILFAAVGTALSTAFIPIFFEIDKQEGRKKSLIFTNNVLNIVILLSIIIAILGFIFAEPLVKVFAMNFTGDKLQLAIKFTKIMIFGLIFIGLSNMMTAWLQINDKFSIPGMTGLPFNILIILGVFLSTYISINIMALASLLAMVSMFLFQLPFSVRYGYKYKLYLNIKDKYIRKMFMLVMPVFIGVGVNQVNAIVDRSLASTLGDGFITILNSANRLNNFVIGLFIMTIAAVIFPNLSKLCNEDNIDQFKKSVTQSINSVIILIMPISIGAIVLSEPVVRVVFERGAFKSNATSMTAIALACYSIGMVGVGLREILNKVFYSLQDTKTPMINGAMTMGMNIVLNIIFVKLLGYSGLALATSLSALICITLLTISLNKKIGYFGQGKICNTMIKTLIASIIMGIITNNAYKLISIDLGVGVVQEIIALFGSVIIGALIYAILIIILKVDEVNIILNKFKIKFKKNNIKIGA